MRKRSCYTLLLALGLGVGVPLASLPAQNPGPRLMENLGRGVVAVPESESAVFVSWRILGLDPTDIAFNLYRSTDGGAWVKLNDSLIDGGTNFRDETVDLSQSNAYRVHPVIDGEEAEASAAYTIAAGSPAEPVIRIPLREPHDRQVHHVWVGDVDGDGEYEFFAAMTGLESGQSQKLGAYKLDGTFLWEVDFGPNSVDPDGVYPNAAAISAGQWDGVTVYDIDSDGKAEVIVKSANGVTFGDGEVLEHSDDVTQFISILDGLTGAEKARTVLPNPWKDINNRPLGALFGIGYPDGREPSLMIHAKSRVGGSGSPFYITQSAWDYRDGALSERWTINFEPPNDPPVSHQIRIVDVDGDGKDEFVPGMHVINSDGSLLYNLGDQGVVHGDRFHIGDLDPNRPGLEGYGIQQNNPSGLTEYFYDAATGQILWTLTLPEGPDAARGVAGDVDPRYPGYELWSFYGMRTVDGMLLAEEPNRPWPNLRIWWDGDVLSENLEREKLEKWDYENQSLIRLLTAYRFGASAAWRNVPAFYGDILGDWREEIVYANGDHSELILFTTTIPSDVRLYTLLHNPAYRNSLTVKGYVQSNMTDYYLGYEMSMPPSPNIEYVSVAPTEPSVPGDLDGDGDIDNEDRKILFAAMGSCAGDPGYVEAADYNGDGCIDKADFQVWQNYFRLSRIQHPRG